MAAARPLSHETSSTTTPQPICHTPGTNGRKVRVLARKVRRPHPGTSISAINQGRVRGKEVKSREKLNELEKNRNKKLNDIFLDLRKLLQESAVPTKKDKINILKNTSELIIQLQHALTSAQNWLSNQLPDPKPSRFLNREDYPDLIFENMFRKTNVAFVVLDVDGHIKDCNPICSELLHLPEYALRTMSFFQFIPSSELPDIYRAFALLLSSPQISVHSMKKSLVLVDNMQLQCTLSMWQVNSVEGEPSMIHVMVVPAVPPVSINSNLPSVPPPL